MPIDAGVDGSPETAKLALRIGRGISRLRARLGVDQKSFAARAGLSRSYLCQIEAGQRLPSVRVLVVLANELKVHVRELVR